MGVFEQHPWLLLPVIVVTVELWSALKAAALHVVRGSKSDDRTTR